MQLVPSVQNCTHASVTAWLACKGGAGGLEAKTKFQSQLDSGYMGWQVSSRAG